MVKRAPQRAISLHAVGRPTEQKRKEDRMELLKKTVAAIRPVDKGWYAKAQARLDNLTKPPGSLGRLEEFASRLVAIAENVMPVMDKKVIFTFAGDHGVVDEGVAAYPREVTAQMVFNILKGGAAISVLARHAGSEVVVVDMGVDYDFEGIAGLVDRKVMRGTKNFAKGPAMTRDEAVRCLEAGIELAEGYVAKGYSLFGTGDMGIGNTTPSSAIVSVITGASAADVTGRGTGISDEALVRKAEVIEAAIRLNTPDPRDGVDVLAKVGGTEIGGIAGLILGAAAHGKPIVIDGFISTAGALIAYTIAPAVKDYMFAAHNSVEKGHKVMLATMGLTPILDLGMRLGEGTGGALAMLMIEGGLKMYKEMATFDEAGVTNEIVN
jgi:nicotinate-nucleotide--dimethylbenzimidazole phosphoribosyltransferase